MECTLSINYTNVVLFYTNLHYTYLLLIYRVSEIKGCYWSLQICESCVLILTWGDEIEKRV